jgi:uncharacterized protein YfaS (alpha-2-macroglobulin family)
MHRVKRRRLGWFVMLLGVAACVGGARQRAGAPTTQLRPDLSDRASAAAGEFRIVFAAPRDEAAASAEITLLFSHPLRALDRADVAPPALAITPPIAGAWHWVGARALTFAPTAGRLPPATEFSVEVPDTLRAADGARLKSAYRFGFTTPRPRLANSTPADGEAGVLPDSGLKLAFNQRVGARAVERWGRLTIKGRSLPFAVERGPAEEPLSLIVRPRQRLPLDSEVVFRVESGLVSDEGPLAAGAPTTVTFRTLGPMRVTGVECNRDPKLHRCMPGYGVGLSFSNPARMKDVARAISISPKLALKPTSDDTSTSYFELPPRMAAGQNYDVRVAAGLRDIYGQRLERDFTTRIAMDDFLPHVMIGVSDGSVVPADRGPIPIWSVNTKAATLVYAPLAESDLTRPAMSSDFAKFVTAHSKASRIKLVAGVKNQPQRAELDLLQALGPNGLGVVGLAAEYERDARDGVVAEPRLLKLSDLALSAKFSASGSSLWVTRLSSAAPVPGAEVRLVAPSGESHQYTTDAAGFVAIPSRDFAPVLDYDSKDRQAVLVVKAGPEWTFERVGDVVEPWQLSVPTDTSGHLGIDGLLFSDRGVYRPGDVLRVKGIVRRQTPRGVSVPSGERARLVLSTPDGEVVTQHEVGLSRFGTFASEFTMPTAAALGSYLVSARLGKDSLEHRVQVEEYRPVEFKVEVNAPSSAIRGDQVQVGVHGTYLYGADMANAAASAHFSRSSTGFTAPGTEGFSLGAEAYYSDLEAVSLDAGSIGGLETHLDGQGTLKAPAKLTLGNQRGPERVLVDAEVTDVGRQSVAGSASILVHPAEFYLGIATPSTYFVETPRSVQPKIIAVTPSGARVAGQRVKVELIARRWAFAREDNGGGYPESVFKVVDDVVGGCELTTQREPASCALDVKRAGYYLVRARATDSRKNPVEAAISFYGLGAGETSFRGSDGNGVELVLDKPSYRVGETAKVLVKSPFPEAEALVTVERADVMHSARQTLRGSLPTLSIPVTEEFRPNAFVSVVLFRPLGKNAASIPGAAYRIGYANIMVEAESRRLDVKVTPSASELEPGASLAVDLQVRDREGRAAASELTLYAVDEGVLALTGYTIPDPLLALSQPRPLAVSTLDTRTQIAKLEKRGLLEMLGVGKGAEAGGGGLGLRQDFRATAYFNPSLVTDAAGKASVRFKLPDSLSSYRVMAVAVGEGEHYGFGSTSVTTSRRLMVRPALPRLLRVGDELEAAVVVASKDFDPGEVEVSVSVKGVRLRGPATQSLRLERGAQKEVRFAVKAEAAGNAEFRFTAAAKGARDTALLTIPVRLPAELEAVALSGETRGEAAEGIGSLSGVRSDLGRLSLSLSTSALVGLDAGLEALSTYPYGCTEQLSSRLLPVAALSGLSRDFGLPRSSDDIKGAAELIRILVSRQHGDGGFSLWPENEASETWVSAYALWSLYQAHQTGLDVPKRVLDGGRRYLRATLSKPEDTSFGLAAAAYAVDVLSDLGAADRGYMNRLFEARAKLPLFARALLLHAFAVEKVEGPTELLLRELEGQVRVTGTDAVLVTEQGRDFSALFDSEARSQALLLRAMVAARRGHPLAAPLARGLLSMRRAGSWRTTQETAFALVALDAYRRAEEPSAPNFAARVLLGDREVVQRDFRGRSLAAVGAQIDMPTLVAAKGAPLRFAVEGSGTLFYEARLEYARREPPRTPLDAGFYVERRFSALMGGAPAGSAASSPAVETLSAGSVMRAEITVVSVEPRDFVVIDDPLPAGLEAINSNLSTSSLRYGSDEFAQESEPAPLTHRELRDDRALFFVDHLPAGVFHYRYLVRATGLGRFVVPSTRALAMYEPEIFGRTGAGVVVVR